VSHSQCTIRDTVEMKGKGLHEGVEVTLRLLPAGANEGLSFVRVDLEGKPRIPANPETINTRLRRTSVMMGDAEVQTIEHLLSSLAGLGIDNLNIEIDGPEIPGGDGSAKPFVDLLQKAGRVHQDVPRKQIHLSEPIFVQDGELSLYAVPSEEGLNISYTFQWWSDHGKIDYSLPAYASEHYSLKLSEETFAIEIAPARTFVAEVEAKKLQAMGLGRGANYSNTLVVGNDGVIENELRFPNEFARHKILDLIGDLFILGGQLNCHIVAIKSGHNLNRLMVERIQNQLVEKRPATKKLSAAEEKENQIAMDIRAIADVLPHRFPFLLVDRVVEVEEGKRAVGIKNVTINEPFFQGHFPGMPVMPGVLQLEAMAQMAGLMLASRLAVKNKVIMLLQADKVKWRRAVVPGDQLVIETVAVRIREKSGEVKTTGTVDGTLVTEANIRFMIVDRDSI